MSVRRTSERGTAGRAAWLLAMLMSLLLAATACGSDGDEESAGDETATEAEGEASGDDASGDEASGDEASEDASGDDAMAEDNDPGADATAPFPANIDTDAGPVMIEQAPTRIVSLSPTATEMLYAIGAGDRVVAVDLFSNYPDSVPEGTLDGFAPDLEAILGNTPDLVVASFLPEDILAGLVDGGVPVLIHPAAASFDDTYDQVAQLGIATGEIDGATGVNADIRAGVDQILAGLPASDEPIRVFHEIDDSFYTATSNSFIGQVYVEMGFENIADPLDDGSGFPLIDGESIIAADPSLIVFTDQVGYEAADIAGRPGWETTAAVSQGNIVQVNADIASRWGPRIVEFMQAVADTVAVPAG